MLSRMKAHLETGNSARSCQIAVEEFKYIEDLHLLTIKPVMYVCNVDEKSAKSENNFVLAVKNL